MGGNLQPVLNEDRLRAAIGSTLKGLESPPGNALFRIVDGKPEVVAARAGGVADSHAQFAGVLEALAKLPGPDRVATARLTALAPAFTTADAAKLGITEKVSELHHLLPACGLPQHHIGRAAELLNGTSGEARRGLQPEPDLGGADGSAWFRQGHRHHRRPLPREPGRRGVTGVDHHLQRRVLRRLEDVDHRAHGFAIDRYPVGREATLDWGTLT